jgi:hypothetical protein
MALFNCHTNQRAGVAIEGHSSSRLVGFRSRDQGSIWDKENGGRMRGSNVGTRIEQVRILDCSSFDSSLEHARAHALCQWQRILMDSSWLTSSATDFMQNDDRGVGMRALLRGA